MDQTMTPEVKSRFDNIDKAIAELSTAITGNKVMGHRGIVERLETVELLNSETPGVHIEMENRAKEARAQIYQRIDTLQDEWAKWKWFVAGLSAGFGVAGGVGATWLIDRIPG